MNCKQQLKLPIAHYQHHARTSEAMLWNTQLDLDEGNGFSLLLRERNIGQATSTCVHLGHMLPLKLDKAHVMCFAKEAAHRLALATRSISSFFLMA